MAKKRLTKRDYEFMNSLGAAILEKSPKRIRVVIVFWLISIVALIVWMAFTQIDEIARGSGEVIPISENQLIQNLEGGILKEIVVSEGSFVKKGDILLKIDNQKSKSSYEANQISTEALEAKIFRLEAEANGRPLKVKSDSVIVKHEINLFEADEKQRISKEKIVKAQLYQKEQELREVKSRLKLLEEDMRLIKEEVSIMEPLVKRGVKSKYDFLKLKREQNSIKKEYEGVRLSIPRLKSSVQENKERLREVTLDFETKAREQLNETVSKLQMSKSNKNALEDQVKRTIVRSPINGVIQKLFVHTVGGVVRPGENLIEIVPSDSTLLIEVKIKPSDIAFIYIGQKAKVKFSAYDFAIFGSLDGKVVNISADSITDDKGVTYFKVRIKTNKSYLGSENKQLKIIPGMTVDVDILTGKKSILDYILKPILKTKQYSFSEH